MHIGFTPEQDALRRELRAYFAALMTPEVDAEVSTGDTGGPHCLEAVRRMGRDGWLGIGWPREYGGQGRGQLEQLIFYDEAWRARAPVPALTINTVARTLMEFGTTRATRVLPAADPARRVPFRDRLHGAQRRHGPGVAAHPGGA